MYSPTISDSYEFVGASIGSTSTGSIPLGFVEPVPTTSSGKTIVDGEASVVPLSIVTLPVLSLSQEAKLKDAIKAKLINILFFL